MDATRRTFTLSRVATTASLAALLIPVGQADAAKRNRTKKPRSPVITSVSPMKATVGDTLTIKGRHFRKGKGRNSVGFKRDGAAVVFLKAGVSTKKTMVVKLSSKLEEVLYGEAPARFHLRVLAKRFGKRYTPNKRSPTISPRPDKPGTDSPGDAEDGGDSGDGDSGDGDTTPTFDPAGPNGDCDGDTVLNKDEAGDIDDDLLSDELENRIGTDGCNADSDDDGVSDAYEYKSAVDLNDDEYQQPNEAVPYPGKRPYPNPLDGDADRDYDRDVLTLREEFDLWAKQGGLASDETWRSFADKHLSYSDGLQYSVYERCPSAGNPQPCGTGDANRRVPTLAADGYDKQAGFLQWAGGAGYLTLRLQQVGPTWGPANPVDSFDARDVNRDGAVSTGCRAEALYYDYDCDGYLSDNERDEDADGLTNYDESHGRMQPGYWQSCYATEAPFPIPYAGTDLADPDTDGDGIRDGADDQDHDDVPNMMELSRMDASKAPDRPLGFNDTDGRQCTPREDLDSKQPNHPDAYGKVQPFDSCDPAPWSRTCDRHPELGKDPDPNWWSLQ